MAVKRQAGRYIAKLPVVIKAGEKIVEGTTVRVSEKGFFVRAQQSFLAGSPVEIILTLTDDMSCRLKGVIKYARRIDFIRRDNGMGIELTETDERYREFIQKVKTE
ncbi:MAG: PilZ domain-containing protein [Thermodesulfovibrionales bacterium]